jgi:hypothetical protein
MTGIKASNREITLAKSMAGSNHKIPKKIPKTTLRVILKKTRVNSISSKATKYR